MTAPSLVLAGLTSHICHFKPGNKIAKKGNKIAKNKINLPYIAGFFDGEGCITFSKIRKYNPMMKKRYPCTTIRMEIVNTDFGIMKQIYKYFKTGHLIKIKPRKKVNKKITLFWETFIKFIFFVSNKISDSL